MPVFRYDFGREEEDAEEDIGAEDDTEADDETDGRFHANDEGSRSGTNVAYVPSTQPLHVGFMDHTARRTGAM